MNTNKDAFGIQKNALVISIVQIFIKFNITYNVDKMQYIIDTNSETTYNNFSREWLTDLDLNILPTINKQEYIQYFYTFLFYF